MTDFDNGIPPILQEQYNNSIPEKLAMLQNLLNNIYKQGNEEALKDFKFQIHKMAGSAGLYGYMPVSLLCKELEQILIVDIQNFNTLGVAKIEQSWIIKYEDYLKKIKTEFKK